MVLIAALALLFTARYPKPIYDFVLGMNRWGIPGCGLKPADDPPLPPFRLDMGGQEPPPEPGPTATSYPGPDTATVVITATPRLRTVPRSD